MQEKINRLRWQCRRGMLELDILLLSFLEKHYVGLSAVDQVLFEQLLSYHDLDLFQYLVKQEPVAEPLLQKLVEGIYRGY